MELFVVDHGDDYERYSIGIARSLDEARTMARAYLASRNYPPSSFDFFGVIRFMAGELGSDDHVELTLD
jgi:hypothetical protein